MCVFYFRAERRIVIGFLTIMKNDGCLFACYGGDVTAASLVLLITIQNVMLCHMWAILNPGHLPYRAFLYMPQSQGLLM